MTTRIWIRRWPTRRSAGRATSAPASAPCRRSELLRESLKLALIVRDLMIGNPRLADPAVGRKQGFKANVELAQGYNAFAAGTQGQRQWTDYYSTFDVAGGACSTARSTGTGRARR
jgi:hypothetical protein